MSSLTTYSVIYKDVNTITWSGDIIRRALDIDERMYKLLLTKLQAQMTALGLLGERLNTARAKALLRRGFTVIYLEFDSVFRNVPERWKDRCLTFLAQRCNYNKRRRTKDKRAPTNVGRQGVAPSSDLSQPSDITLPSSTDDERPGPLKSVQNTMLQVHRDVNHSTSCRPQDMLVAGRLEGTVKVDDLDFSKFISLIVKELGYNDKQDMIVYERVGVVNMHITNELEWRTALSEMHTEGAIRFFFVIKRTTP